MCAAWIGFFGSILGGLLTLLGVKYTIDYYKKIEVDQIKSEKKKNIALLYWNLKSHKEVISAMYKLISNGEPFGLLKSCNEYDYQFYLNKIIYVQDVLEYSEINTIILYYHCLFEIEEERVKGDERNEEFIKKLIRSLNGDEMNGKKVNIDSILSKLKPYAEK